MKREASKAFQRFLTWMWMFRAAAAADRPPFPHGGTVRGIDPALSVGVPVGQDLADIARGRRTGTILGVSITDMTPGILKHRFWRYLDEGYQLITSVYRRNGHERQFFTRTPGWHHHPGSQVAQEALTDLSPIWHVQDAVNLARRKASWSEGGREDIRRAAIL